MSVSLSSRTSTSMILPSVTPFATSSGERSFTLSRPSAIPVLLTQETSPSLIAWTAKPQRPRATLDRDLRPDLDHAPGRDLEIIGGVVGAAGKLDEQPVLPARHAGFWRRFQRAARQEERRRHDVE